MHNPPANGTALVAVDPREVIPFASVGDTVVRVVEEYCNATNARAVVDDKLYFWPAGGEIRVNMSGLPTNCGDIAVAIHSRLETVGDDNYVLFPVESVEIDSEAGTIRVIGDRDRVTQTRPLPVS